MISYRNVLIIISAAGILLRFLFPACFEFKADELKALELGIDASNGAWYIKHGMLSGVGLFNAPGFSYLMGLFTLISRDPFIVNLIFIILNCAALPVAAFLIYRRFERLRGIIYFFLISLSPWMIVYSRHIWAQNLLFPFSVLAALLLTRLKRKPWLAVVFAMVLSIILQLHQSSIFFYFLFLFTSLVIEPIRKAVFLFIKQNKIISVLSMALFLLTFVSYFHHLFIDSGIQRFFDFAGAPHSFSKDAFEQVIQMATGTEFFLKFVGGGRVLYSWPITGLPNGILVFGYLLIPAFLMGLYKIAKSLRYSREMKSILVKGDQDIFAGISVIVVTGLTLMYFLLKINSHHHYFIIIIPFILFISAEGIYQFLQYNIRFTKQLVVASFVAYISTYLFLLLFVVINNGSVKNYGLAYKSQFRIAEEVSRLGAPIDLKIAESSNLPKSHEYIENVKYIIKNVQKADSIVSSPGAALVINIEFSLNENRLNYKLKKQAAN